MSDAPPESEASRSRSLAAALGIGAAAACLFCGYEFVRSTSNTLFKDAFGRENIPLVMACTPLAVAGVLYAYGRTLSRCGPRATLRYSGGASAGALILCYALHRSGWTPAAALLYVVRETYVVLLVEQYWSFLNSTLGVSAARRLNGAICGVASLGSILGGLALSRLATDWGSEAMVLCGAACILPAAFLADLAYRRCGEPRPEPLASEPPANHGALRLGLFRQEPRLLLLLGAVCATQALAAALELIYQGRLDAAFPARGDEQTAFSGLFFAWLNAAALVSQFLLTPLAIRFLPPRALHAALPFANAAACAALLGSPGFAAIGVAYILFKALDYSLFRAAKEILYIPFSFDVRYRAKELIDVFGYRFGKGGAALGWDLARRWGGPFGDAAFACGALAAALAWLCLIVPAARSRPPDSTESPETSA